MCARLFKAKQKTTLHCFLLHFIMLLSAHFSSLYSGTTLWHYQPFPPTCNLAVASSRSLMKMLNTTGSSLDPWRKALVTDLQVDLLPQDITIWVWPFSKFSFCLTVCSSNLYFSVKILQEILKKALLK